MSDLRPAHFMIKTASAVLGISRSVLSRANFGDFYRPLAPGAYRVEVHKEGFIPAALDITVPSNGSSMKHPIILRRKPRKRQIRLPANLLLPPWTSSAVTLFTVAVVGVA